MANFISDPLECVDRRVGSIWELFDKSKAEMIGSGAFGNLYAARSLLTGETVALKIIKKSPAVGLKLSKKRISRLFSTEVDILKSVDHPGIVRYLGSYEDDQQYIISMEYLRGGPLFDRIIQREHYSELVASKMVIQMVSAILYLHEKKICHLDLKPENFVLAREDDDESLKLIDFGLSLRVNEEKDTYPACGTGTYKSPEMKDVHGFRRTPLMLERSDSYSLGIVVYAMLCGEFPEFNDEKQIQFPKRVALSAESKNFIRGLTAFSFIYRLSMEKALKHVWVRGNAPDIPLLRRQMFSGLKNFQFMTLFQKSMVKLLSDNLSETERAKLTKAFLAMDDDQDGNISVGDLTRLFVNNKKKLGIRDEKQAVARAHSLFRKADIDEDGKLSPSDLEEIQILGGIVAPDGDFSADLHGLFNLIDVDGDGELTMNEMGTFLVHNTEEEISQMFSSADKNNDGKLDINEFLHAVKGRMSRTPSLASLASRRSIASRLMFLVGSRSSLSTIGSPRLSINSSNEFDIL